MQCFIFHLQQHFTGWNKQPALNSCTCLTPGKRFCLPECFSQTLYFLLCRVQAHLPNHQRVRVSETGWECQDGAAITHLDVFIGLVFGLVWKPLKSTERVVLTLVSFSQALNNQLILLFLHSRKSTGFACPVFLVSYRSNSSEMKKSWNWGGDGVGCCACWGSHHWFLLLGAFWSALYRMQAVLNSKSWGRQPLGLKSPHWKFYYFLCLWNSVNA